MYFPSGIIYYVILINRIIGGTKAGMGGGQNEEKISSFNPIPK